jgi:hypothetical protein
VNPPLDYQVLLLTGQSDPAQWALSPPQQAFFDASVPPAALFPFNFPYRPSSRPYRHTPLPVASVRNAWQYLHSRRRRFAERHTGLVRDLIETHERTILLAGSCGLELFNNLRLPASIMPRVRLFAYGPVARRRPDCEHLLVGSRRDLLSRWYFPEPDRWVDCSHLDYIRSPAVRELWLGFMAKTTVACA